MTSWITLDEELTGWITGVFATRFQFFLGRSSPRNTYLQLVAFEKIPIMDVPTAKVIPRALGIPLPTLRFQYSEVKYHYWLYVDGEKILVSATGMPWIPEGVKIRIRPPIHVNDYDLRVDLKDEAAVGEHFPEQGKIEVLKE